MLDHGTVTLRISLGKERYSVPKVARMTVDQAQDALLKQHLTYGRSFLRYDDSAPKGMVLGSNPAAGQRETPGFQVDLIVSKGPRPIQVRDWTGKSADRAVRVMRAQGLQVDTGNQQYSDSVPEGHVISQTPLAGVLHRGDTVSLTVSKGPELVQIPGDLRAMGVEAATDAAEGPRLQGQGRRTPTSTSASATSSDPTPSPGSMARKGSTVVLKVV